MRAAKPLLEVNNLIVNLGSKSKWCSFKVNGGELVWVVGPSGAGKTSLLRTLARLNATISGEVILNERDWNQIPAAEWRTKLLYVHQKPVVFPGAVETNLQLPFTLKWRRDSSPDMKLAARLLSDLLLPDDILTRDACRLSVGESARVALVRSLIVNPEVLLLDEVTASLDPEARSAVSKLLKIWLADDCRCIVATAHDENLRQDIPGLEITLNEMSE